MSIEIHGAVERQGVSAITQLVDDSFIASATYLTETTSTNSLALEQVRRDELRKDQIPRLYLADMQTAGRGRHGRTWLSKEDSLTFSLLMKRTNDATLTTSLWPIAVGVAVARAIEFCFAPLRTQLKWPNDVYLDGSKVAGILLETTHGTPETVVIGIGVNTNSRPTVDDSNCSAADSINAQSIAAVVGRQIDRYALLSQIIQQIIETLQQATATPQEICSDYQRRCLLAGKAVRFLDNGTHQTATCRGINDSGELLLETPNGLRACNTGEVNLVRPF